jgi:hypothetical protein
MSWLWYSTERVPGDDTKMAHGTTAEKLKK